MMFCEIIFPHFWYLSNFTCILGSIRLSLVNEIDAIHWKRTNIRRVLHQSSSISALPEHFFGDVSVAQLVALVSGVVLGGVAEVVGSNLARGKIFTASIDSVDSLYPSLFKSINNLLSTCRNDENGGQDWRSFKMVSSGASLEPIIVFSQYLTNMSDKSCPNLFLSASWKPPKSNL